MAILRNPDGSVAQFLINDGQGNECIGHLELTVVASFEAGSRNGDLTFRVDETILRATPNQSPGELLAQAPQPRTMS
jgi:hypothetical protein